MKTPHDWSRWLGRLLLMVGLTLLLCGIIFFFAYNWVRISPVLRFTLVEGLFVLASLCAVSARKHPLISALATLAAAVLAGVFWAVFGQIYQTGADAWQLFALWLLFLLPWLALRPNFGLWILAVAVANTALFLWGQTEGMHYTALLNGGLSLVCFLAVGHHSRARVWLLAPLPLLLGLCTWFACGALLELIHEYDPEFSGWAIYAMACLGLTLVLGLRYRHMPTLTMLALAGFPLLNVAISFIWSGNDLSEVLAAGLYWLANLGYAFFLAKNLPRLPHAHIRVLAQKLAGQSNQPHIESISSEKASTSLVMQLVLGVAAFFCSLCLALFAVLLINLGSSDDEGIALMGLCFLGAGISLYRAGKPGPFRSPLSMSMALSGFLLVLVYFVEFERSYSIPLAYAVVVLVGYCLFPAPGVRFLAVLSALCLFMFQLSSLAMYSMEPSFVPACVLSILCALLLIVPATGRAIPVSLWPAAWAGALVLPSALPPWTSDLGSRFIDMGSHYGEQNFSWFSFTLCAALLLLLILGQAHNQSWNHVRRAQHMVGLSLLVFGTLALSFLTLPEIVLALFFLGLGHLLALRRMIAWGAVLLALSLFFYYYNLDITLLQKAGRMCLGGLMLMAGGALAFYFSAGTAGTGRLVRLSALTAAIRPRLPRSTRAKALAALAVISLLAFQYAIWDKEQLLASGQELLLRLRPYDPRSLMQGDYMSLAYALDADLQELEDSSKGYALLRIETLANGRQVGELAEQRGPEDIGEEIAIAWHSDSQGTRLRLPDSFMFQEGHADIYETAQYAVLRCSSSGQCLLTGLADEQGNDLTSPRQ